MILDCVKLTIKTMQPNRGADFLYCVSERPSPKVNAKASWVWLLDCKKKVSSLPQANPKAARPTGLTLPNSDFANKAIEVKIAQPVRFKPRNSVLILIVLQSPALRNRRDSREQDKCILMGSK